MNKQKCITSLTLLLMLGGCANMQTTDPYTGEQKASNTATGAGIGALTGAIVGAIAGDGKGAAVGAAIGGLAGGAIGNYMDKQEAQLRQELRGSGVQVIRQGDNIQLVMSSNVTFQLGSANLNPDFFTTLNSVAKVLNKYTETQINITGHTDNTGSFSRNQELSVQRAQTVAGYLKSQRVNANRFFISGMADQQPIASNDTAEGRAINRRVEITLQPIRR